MIARGNPRNVLIRMEYFISPYPILLGIVRFIEYKNRKTPRLVSIAFIISFVNSILFLVDES